MKRRDYGKYLFTAGLILFVVQFLIILTNILNGDLYSDEQFVVVQEITFIGVIKEIWSSVLGIVLLIYVYLRRFLKLPDPMLELVGAMLWIIQILSLHTEGTPLLDFALKYIFGVLGIVCIGLTAVSDSVYLSKLK